MFFYVTNSILKRYKNIIQLENHAEKLLPNLFWSR